MRKDLAFSDYSSTRVDADLQRMVNVYPHSQRGYRQLPGLVELGVVADAKLTIDVSAQQLIGTEIPGGTNLNRSAFAVTDDGTKIHQVRTGDKALVEEIDISPAHDMSSLSGSPPSVDRSFTLTHPTPDCRGFAWGDSGSKFYAADGDFTIYQYTAATPYLVTSLSYDSKSYSTISETTMGGIGSIAINSVGTKLFALSDTSIKQLKQFTLATAWDISTATYDSKFLDYTALSVGSALASMTTDPTMGLVQIAQSGIEGNIFQWSLSIKTDLTSAVLDGSFDGTATQDMYDAMIWADGGDILYSRGIDDTGAAAIQTKWLGEGYQLAGTRARGSIEMDGVLYIVVEGTLYSVDSAGTETDRGTILSGPVGLSTDGTNLVITAAEIKYNYTVAGGLVTITDGDLGDAFTSAYLDSRFYYDQPNGQFVASALNDPTSIDALDFGTAESLDDDLLAVFSHNQLVYMCGEKSIEVWFTTGVDRPPIDRQKVIQKGIVGHGAIDSNDNMVYFLDNNRRPNQMFGLDYKQIFTPALGEEFDSYTVFSDCIVNCYTWEQENFAEFYFPTQNITWTFHENSGTWFKNEDTSNNAARPAFYAEAYNKLLGLDRDNGKIYNFRGNIYRDDNNAITRTIDSGIITSEIWGAPGLDLILNEVCITAQATSAATVNVSLSTNLTTFGSSRVITLAGGINRLSLYTWGEFREGIIRLTTTSNVKVDIVELTGDAELLRA